MSPGSPTAQCSGFAATSHNQPSSRRFSAIRTSTGLFRERKRPEHTTAMPQQEHKYPPEEGIQAQNGRARSWLAAIVESSEDAIISKSLDGIIESWNAGAERIYGYTEAEAVGSPISLIIPPELLGEEEEILDRLRAGDRLSHFE